MLQSGQELTQDSTSRRNGPVEGADCYAAGQSERYLGQRELKLKGTREN